MFSEVFVCLFTGRGRVHLVQVITIQLYPLIPTDKLISYLLVSYGANREGNFEKISSPG